MPWNCRDTFRLRSMNSYDDEVVGDKAQGRAVKEQLVVPRGVGVVRTSDRIIDSI